MERTYTTDEIEVSWDSGRCIHVGFCSKALIEVFNPERRPWIQLDAGELGEIIQVVENCPSGALTYNRIDGGAQEQVDATTTIVPWPNGPYFVRGSFQVEDRHGDVYDTAPRATLCRCGHTSNHPFCDLSHRDVGFRDYPRVNEPDGGGS